MQEIKLSVASYSFHKMINDGKLNVFGYLDLLKYRYHIDWADIWTEGCIKSFDEDYIKSIRRYMDERDIKLANLCVDGPCVWVDDAEKRGEHKQKMLGFLKVAKILGAKTVRIDFGGPSPYYDTVKKAMVRPDNVYNMSDEAFSYIVDTFKEYCAVAEDFGCMIGPENHWGWDNVPFYMKKVKDAVNHPAYGHLYHLGNFYDKPEEGEELAISYAMHTHVHATSMPYAKEVIRKLLNSGYKGTIGIEHHSGKYETERVEWQLGSVRAMIAELRDEDLSMPAAKDFMNEVYKK